MVRILTTSVWPACLIVAAGCQQRPDIPAEHLSGEAIASPNPFAATSMVVHPLTRLDLDAAGTSGRIVCHLELRDSWDDPCKGVGRVQINLVKPTVISNVGESALTWEVDLADLPTNARLYDQATRTYRLALEDVPDWLVAKPATGRGASARLVVTLTCPDVEGKPQRLRAEYTIER